MSVFSRKYKGQNAHFNVKVICASFLNHTVMSKNKQLAFSGKTIYTGLDIHWKDWKVCILFEERVYKEF